MAEDTTISDERIRRFHPARIIEHWSQVAFFAVLVATGLSQKFYYLDVSQWLILQMGGIDRVRLIHRVTGFIFSLGIGAHLATAVIGVVHRKWQLSMIITKKDFTDVVHNIRYYLGIERLPTQSGRYTYKQKFEYWAIVTGVLIMIVSGLILWFPLSVTTAFPGEIIPAAKALHSNEALVVFLIISLWHIYNAIFSPEIFPLDTSIFTGYLSKERMLQEHPLEFTGGKEGTSDTDRPATL